MAPKYTAVVQRDGPWWIGWVEEIPGVNSQGRTRDELLDNLRDALAEAVEMNRAEARAACRVERLRKWGFPDEAARLNCPSKARGVFPRARRKAALLVGQPGQ